MHTCIRDFCFFCLYYMISRILLSACTILIVLFAYYFSSLDIAVVSTVHRIFASIFILFLPWYWISLVFFNIDELHRFERWVMSLIISLAVIPFILILSNLLWFYISIVWWYLCTSIIIFIFSLVVLIKNSRH